MDDSQKINSINTILSHTGSRIVPSLLTRLNLLATTPSRESESPIREMIYEFEADDISFGMEIGGGDVTKSSVKFDTLDYSTKDHRTIISARGDVRFLSGVELKNPALTLEASNFEMKNSLDNSARDLQNARDSKYLIYF